MSLIIIITVGVLFYPSWKSNLSIYTVMIALFAVAVVYVSVYKDVVTETFQVSSEAIQNVGSIFNKEQMIVKNLTVTGAFNYLPKGTIVAWTGATAPGGWALCDGTNGTPDLRGRFILGAGQGAGLANRNLSDKGGEENHTLNVDEIPSHQHSLSALYEHHRSFSGANGGDHPFKNNSGTNTYKTDLIGGGKAHNNMPPFYALAFIMKQ